MDRSPSGGVTGCIVSKFSSVVCNKLSTGISPQSQGRHATRHPPAPAIPRPALGLRRPKIRKRSPCVSWRDLKNRAARRRGREDLDVAVEERDGREAPASKLAGTDDNDRGTPPNPRCDSKRTTARRAGTGRQSDGTGAKTRRVGVITTAHRKKIFARFFRLKKNARELAFYREISKFLPDSFP